MKTDTASVAMLARFEELAMSAGSVIMAIRSDGVRARSKADQSPVTEADEQAEKIILAGLAKYYPTIPVVAEESAASGSTPPDLGDRFFLVDPLDGTKEFIGGSGEFTVNIALIEFGIPVVGVVYAPALGTIYSGAGDIASKCTILSGSPQARVQLAPQRYSGPPRVVASRSHLTKETEDFLNQISDCQTVNIGSSLKFCLLAEGSADLYPRFGRTMEWDTAAGDAVLRATGGTTKTQDGKPLVYGKKNQAFDSDFANPFFISRAAYFSETI
jgi:3'(2'), 5'-bisphosphate nucleotidase